MSSEKKDFFGREVADAIRSACEAFAASPERLDIDVVATGSTGIFGLIRKKAHIRAAVKPDDTGGQPEQSVFAEAIAAATPKRKTSRKPVKATAADKSGASDSPTEKSGSGAKAAVRDLSPAAANCVSADLDDDDTEESAEAEIELSQDVLDLVRDELAKLVSLMGCPSEVTVSAEGALISCAISDVHEAVLVGPEAKTLDALQYLLRKIVSRKVPERVRLTVNVGDYRERRLEDLKQKALELAGKAKEEGKNQMLPALSPSERRVIHMALQEDSEIRSRSVGEGLFKKILIYQPGKSGNARSAGNPKPQGKRRSSRGRRASAARKKTEDKEMP